jgi:hypothetical protein
MMTRQMLEAVLPLEEALRVYDRCQALQDGTIEGAKRAVQALAAEHRSLNESVEVR